MYQALLNHKRWIAVAIPFALVAAIATASVTSSAPADRAAIAQANDLSQAFRVTAKSVYPSVVSIATKAKPKQDVEFRGNSRELEEMLKNSPFGEMFKNHPEFRHFFREQSFQPSARSGIGSGVIIDKAGIVLTNNHVVDGADEVTVRLHDGREYEATEIKTDSQTDLAVLKIKDAKNLTAAKLGDSDGVEIGDWVLALGQPFGLEGTVTAGIISAKGRGIGINARENYLQTDAAINPGNSGGPLVNLRGEVVGINTAISSSTGGNQGIGFAIPINLAEWVSEQLLTTGTVQRSFLGVGIQQLDHDLAKAFGLEPGRGVVVTQLKADSPAESAGLQMGDVIVKFDDKEIGSPRELQMVVERCKPNTKHEIGVVRDGKTMTLTASTGQLPATTQVSQVSDEESQAGSLGMEVSDLKADVAKQLGIDSDEGVVITNVDPNGRAAEAGLRSGMVIVQVNRQDVSSVADLKKALESSEDDESILMLIRSQNGSRFVVVQS